MRRMRLGAHPHPLEERLSLSLDCILVYVLRESGVRGHLTSGRIERRQDQTLSVYDDSGVPIEYISGDRMRSWRVFQGGTPLAEWSRVITGDEHLLRRIV